MSKTAYSDIEKRYIAHVEKKNKKTFISILHLIV